MAVLIATFEKTKDLARSVSKILSCDFTNIETKDFPDEESYVRFKVSPKGKTVLIFNTFDRDQNNRLIETILAAGIARDYGAKKVILVAPYFPYLRQDTHFEDYDSFSIKYIAPLVEVFDKVYVVDPHLQRIRDIKKIGKNFERLTSVGPIAGYIRDNFKEDYTLVGPDKESRQWAQGVASLLGKQAIVLKKMRSTWRKVKIEEKSLGKRVIIIDDIIGTGHTILETIKVARRHGAKEITVIGVHGILVEGAVKKIVPHAKLVTTNTILNAHSRIDISGLIADALSRA
jgi:ribose-phosphate pyrophosphokinase